MLSDLATTLAPRLLDQVREIIRYKHYSSRTEEAYAATKAVLQRPSLGAAAAPVTYELSETEKQRPSAAATGSAMSECHWTTAKQ